MGFYKRGYFKKPYKMAAARYSKGGALSSTKIARDVLMLKSLINVEKKFIDASISSAISTTPTLTLLNGVATGDTSADRDGNSIKMMTCMIDAFYTLNASATADYIRVALVLDRQPNSAAPTYTDIYEAATVTSPRSKATVDRFTVLREWNIILSTAGNAIKKLQAFYKFKQVSGRDAHVKFNGVGATISSIYTNSLYLVQLGTQPTNTSSQLTNTRIRFIDN